MIIKSAIILLPLAIDHEKKPKLWQDAEKKIKKEKI